MASQVAGSPYWTSVNPIPKQYPYLSDDIDCDVAVIGGGITGALCAYQLAMAGADTVLVDSNLIGYGSTGACVSTANYDADCSLQCLKELIGIEKSVRVFRACARGLESLSCLIGSLGVDVGFTKRDSFYYSPDVSGINRMKDEFLLRKRAGFPVEFYDSMEAADKFSFRVEAGIYTEGLAAELDPYRLTHLLIQTAVKSGLRVYENTSVENIDAQAGGVVLETASRRKISCSKAVNAAGCSAAKVAGNVADMRTCFFITTHPVECFNGWHNRCLLRDDSNPAIYCRTTPDARIIIGGMSSAFIDGTGAVAGLFHLPALAEKKYNTLEQKLISMFTGIEDIIPQYRYSGMYGDTADSLPYIGEMPGCPNVYYDICCGSNGIVFAMLASEIIRDLYFGQSPRDADLFAFNR